MSWSPSSCWRSSCCRSSRTFFDEPRRRAAAADPDAAGRHRLPRRLVVGDLPSGSSRSCCVSWLVASTRHGGKYARDRLLLRLPVIGDDRPVRPGRAVLPDPRRRWSAPACPCPRRCGSRPSRCATASSSSGSAEVHEAMLEGEGLAGPLARDRAVPGHRRPDDPGRRGDRHARRPSSRSPREYYEGELDYKIKKLTALFEPPSSSSWA